ncbi:FAS1-like dehydratase domain-containing protein [Halomarina oriensis]|uniref:Dehydratase n=1 Tax=Halomarina oriensis TaxID=671145 RepID=A0A6B0GUU8_9EURY|nr:MaoC family dehydratase N-terminal domain-containing protein [Halomarina oriensis]MWG36353.1 dehydratase [Halomarina oriensis]
MHDNRYPQPVINLFPDSSFGYCAVTLTTGNETLDDGVVVTDRSVTDLDALVGTTKRTVEGFRVEAGKVDEFARAVGDDDPAHRSAAAAERRGFPAVPAPLTFPRVSSFARYRVDAFDLGFDPQFVLHGEHRYAYDRPLYAGDDLHGDTTLTDGYRREGRRGGTMTFAEFTTEYRTADGERVLTEAATTIETEGAAADDESDDDRTEHTDATAADEPSGAESATRPGSGAPPTDETAADLVGLPVRSGVDDGTTAPAPTPPGTLAVGDEGPAVSVGPLARQDFVRYAGASGDFNPIHYDEPYATNAGHPSVFGQGMLTAGVAAHAVTEFVGLRAVRSFGVRFRSRVWPGDVLTATTRVVAPDDHDGPVPTDGVGLAVTVDRETGGTVLTGTATAGPPDTR